MNTKMILEVAGAKPLAKPTNVTAGGKGLAAEKRPMAVSKNLEISAKTAPDKSMFPKMAQPTNAGEAVPGAAVGGLGVGMWKGVFG